MPAALLIQLEGQHAELASDILARAGLQFDADDTPHPITQLDLPEDLTWEMVLDQYVILGIVSFAQRNKILRDNIASRSPE